MHHYLGLQELVDGDHKISYHQILFKIKYKSDQREFFSFFIKKHIDIYILSVIYLYRRYNPKPISQKLLQPI